VLRENCRLPWRLEDVDAEHPPDKKQGDDGEDDVADPLGRSLRLAKFKHCAILTKPRRIDY
jgi:hypothetical protein